MQPRIIIVAGPNGAGKTTFAREFLPHEAGCPVFLNADLAVQRVASRVSQGGHDIPEATLRRRFAAGIRMFQSVYQPLVDQ